MTFGFFNATCNHISSLSIALANSSAPSNIATPNPAPLLSVATVKSDRYPASLGGARLENFLRVSWLKLTPTVATTSPPIRPIRYVPNGNAGTALVRYTSSVRRSVGKPCIPLSNSNVATSPTSSVVNADTSKVSPSYAALRLPAPTRTLHRQSSRGKFFGGGVGSANGSAMRARAGVVAERCV